MRGEVVATFGRQAEVLAEGRTWRCGVRGRKQEAVCGDLVELAPVAAGQAVIAGVLERRSLFFRSDARRTKAFAANADQIVVVLAARPSFYPALLDRALVAAEATGLDALLVLNKADLPETAAARVCLASYAALGYEVLALSALGDVSPLWPRLRGRTSLLVGQSGMGKSTLVNALLPGALARTREVSAALDSGKHTTTNARTYFLDPGSRLIDSPGVQEFGLAHLSPGALAQAFVEFRPHLGHCRFHNCRHAGEPACALAQAVERGEISVARWQSYRDILASNAPAP